MTHRFVGYPRGGILAQQLQTLHVWRLDCPVKQCEAIWVMCSNVRTIATRERWEGGGWGVGGEGEEEEEVSEDQKALKIINPLAPLIY